MTGWPRCSASSLRGRAPFVDGERERAPEDPDIGEVAVPGVELATAHLPRLQRALEDLDAAPATGRRKTFELAQIDQQPVVSLKTAAGHLQLIAAPAGTRHGYDDLRRGATREHIGQGLRPTVASTADLARMAAALGRDPAPRPAPPDHGARSRPAPPSRARPLARGARDEPHAGRLAAIGVRLPCVTLELRSDGA